MGVVQFLANKEPDIDSIHRLTSHHFYPFEFSKRPYSITVSLDMVVPTNAQATLFFQRTFWSLFLPATVHGRVTDIWRAYITQSLYHRKLFSTLSLREQVFFKELVCIQYFGIAASDMTVQHTIS